MRCRIFLAASVLALAVSLLWGVSSAGPLAAQSAPSPARLAAPREPSRHPLQPAGQPGRRPVPVLPARPGRQPGRPVDLGRVHADLDRRYHRGPLERRLRSGAVRHREAASRTSRSASTHRSRALIEPDVAHPPLVRYEVGGNAGETLAACWAACRCTTMRSCCPQPSTPGRNEVLGADRGIPARVPARLGIDQGHGRRWISLPQSRRRDPVPDHHG